MRIAGVDSDPGRTHHSPLDPKVLQLIEKLANQPLLLEKLLINSQPSLQLQFSQSGLLKQLHIPHSAAAAVAQVTQSPTEIQLSTSQNQVILKLSSQSLSKLANNSIQLYFNQAQMSRSNILQLFQQALPLNNPSVSQTVLTTSDANPQSTANQQHVINQASSDPIKNAISHFLKLKTKELPPLSSNLTNLLAKGQSLSASANSIDANGRLLQAGQILNQASTTEVLSKLAEFSSINRFSRQSELNVALKMNQLFQQLTELQKSLDFSSNNKQLKLAQRVASSGNFFEARLSATNNLLDRSLNGDSKKIQSENSAHKSANSITNIDLKLISLKLKNTLQTLISNLANNNASAVIVRKLLNQLLQHPEFISAMTTQKNPLHSSLPQNAHMSSVAASSDAASPAEKLNSFWEIKSPLLKQIILQQFDGKGSSGISNKQAEMILSAQRQIASEMLLETNAILNKIENNQLLSVRNESPQLQQYLLDLPIFHKQQFQSFELLFKSKQEDAKDKTKRTWSVTVRFDLEPLGPMFAKISLKDNRISTRFFAEQQATAKLLEQNIGHLKSSLFSAGLDIEEVTGQLGIVPKELIVNDEHSVDVRV